MTVFSGFCDEPWNGIRGDSSIIHDWSTRDGVAFGESVTLKRRSDFRILTCERMYSELNPGINTVTNTVTKLPLVTKVVI